MEFYSYCVLLLYLSGRESVPYSVYIKPSPCLSVGAEPSGIRSPWVKMNRFHSTLPQSGALAIVWSTADMGQ